MRFEIVLAPEAVEDLNRFRAYERAAIRDAFEEYLRHEPGKVSKSRIKRLRGLKQPQYRLRMDDVRVFYDIVDNKVEILAIVPKSKAAEWLGRKGEKS